MLQFNGIFFLSSSTYQMISAVCLLYTNYLLTGASFLSGLRLQVYRAEGTTQWYTAVTTGYNTSSQVCKKYNKPIKIMIFREIA